MEKNTQNTALLVMDMLEGITRNYPDTATIVASVGKAIANARAKKIPVIYVAVAFRQGTPEINMNNKSFSTFKERFANVSVEEFSKIIPELAPLAGEVTILKRRVSAFTGSDLEVVLRSQGIQHIVLTGIATSGVVLSTTREAADKDYKITILADCCADLDPEVHRVLTTKVFPRQADVLTLEEWSKV
jgi:nicotinamidase-related amidase